MKIFLSGDGWGAIAAYESLAKEFIAIHVNTNDLELKNKIRQTDILVEGFSDERFDLIICSGHKEIISTEFLKKNKVINIHYSLLPKYRGLHSTVWAIINGEERLGLTVHEMNEKIDDGPIINQHAILYDNQSAKEIMELCNEYIKENLAKILIKYKSGEIKPIPQQKDNATWVCKRNLDDCIVDFNLSVELLKRFFKALVRPYPLPAIIINEKRYEIIKADFKSASYIMHNGRVVNIDEEGVWIKVKDGFIIIQELIDESGNNKYPVEVLKLGMRL